MTKAKKAAAIMAMAFAFASPIAVAGAAGAEGCTYPATCSPNGDQSGQVDQAQVDASTASTGGGTLPVTGGDVLGMAAIGAGALAAGAVLVRRNRRVA
jgi:LPXTG-motif cell wall-anchored protein